MYALKYSEPHNNEYWFPHPLNKLKDVKKVASDGNFNFK